MPEYGDKKVQFRSYENGVLSGIAFEYDSSNLFCYEYIEGKRQGNGIAFEPRIGLLWQGIYVDDTDNYDVEWTAAERIEGLAFSDDKLTYKGLTFTWSGTDFTMSTTDQYAEHKDGVFAQLRAKDENLLSVKITEKYVSFNSSESSKTGKIKKDGSFMALFGAGEYAEIYNGNWAICEYDPSLDTLNLNGKGARYSPDTVQLYIGQFVDDKYNGFGALLGKSYVPLIGNWEDDKLTEIQWSSVH
jgi:hypothetical protein